MRNSGLLALLIYLPLSWGRAADIRCSQALNSLGTQRATEEEEFNYGLEYWKRVAGPNYRELVTQDARRFINKNHIFVSSHARRRGDSRKILLSEIFQALRNENARVVNFENIDSERDSAVFRWVGETERGKVIGIIFSLSENFNVITAWPANVQDTRLYFDPNYSPENAEELYLKLVKSPLESQR